MRPGAALLGLIVGAVLVGSPRAETIEHVVEAGETLWSIAAKADVYADPYLWPVIYKFNRDQIQDPGLIYPKQRLQIPTQIDAEARRLAREKAGASAR
jgi:nucleoid-associated protein YgaU